MDLAEPTNKQVDSRCLLRRGVAQPGSAPALGCAGHVFKPTSSNLPNVIFFHFRIHEYTYERGMVLGRPAFYSAPLPWRAS
jgi:hypothetical protein